MCSSILSFVCFFFSRDMRISKKHKTFNMFTNVRKCSAADPPNVPDTPNVLATGKGRGGQGFVSFLDVLRDGGVETAQH